MAKEGEPLGMPQPTDGVDIGRLRNLLQKEEQREEFEFGYQKGLSFSETAQNMGIPREHWEHPQVRKHVDTHNLLSKIASVLFNEADLAEAITGVRPYEEPSPFNLGREVEQRYRAVKSLVQASLVVLHDEGFDKRKFDPERTTEHLFRERAPEQVEKYGSTVFDGKTFFGAPVQQDEEGVYHVLDDQPIPNKLQERINGAINSYGLEVVPSRDQS